MHTSNFIKKEIYTYFINLIFLHIFRINIHFIVYYILLLSIIYYYFYLLLFIIVLLNSLRISLIDAS